MRGGQDLASLSGRWRGANKLPPDSLDLPVDIGPRLNQSEPLFPKTGFSGSDKAGDSPRSSVVAGWN